MRLRTRTMLAIAVLTLMGAAVLWRLVEPRFAGPSRRVTRPTVVAAPAVPPVAAASTPTALPPARLSSASTSASAPTPGPSTPTPVDTGRFEPALRVSNSSRGLAAMLRDNRAILLRNALIDTASGDPLPVPEHLRAGPEAGAYIVQARGGVNDAFRRAITGIGGTVVSYLPNDAYLVEATAAQADRLRGQRAVQAVLPFEPYFKLEPALLATAVRQEPLTSDLKLNLTLLPGGRAGVLSALERLGAEVEAEFETPFGPGMVVSPPVDSLVALAALPEVQGIEQVRHRQLLNDLARLRLGISSGTNVPLAYTNYLGLDGTNVVININDSGVDATHPDLDGRVTANAPSTLIDASGHGTHVAGTLAGSGRMSGTVSNLAGSPPGSDLRGMAPAAHLYALPIDLITGPAISDVYLQGQAATNHYLVQSRTNLLLSNNSWGYDGAFEYTSASASFDAAVRDALPGVTGPQPILYVFAAGDGGFGSSDGQGGEPNTILAPGTAKNVITVGALEVPREVTNEVVSIGADGLPVTNQVFLARTDTDFQVASFSARGNVEPGIEGVTGRFKPDVVAPGTFVASARSRTWTDPRAFSSPIVTRIENQNVPSAGRNDYSLYVPPGAAEFRILLLPNGRSPNPFPNLPIYMRYGDLPSTVDLVATNSTVQVPPDATLQEGDWYYAVGNGTPATVYYDIQTVVVVTNAFDAYFDELKVLNDGLAPHYRYDTGTSMAAPVATGLLALFADYFQREQRAVTPALLKALLLNGARSAGSLYNFAVTDFINYQGWGVVSITNALPAGEMGSPTGSVHAVQFVDHTGTNSLVTGQSRRWKLNVSPDAVDQILKITLVWTDPPGNPSASVKLVNDLDVTLEQVAWNEQGATNEIVAIYAGNDMPFQSDFTTPRLDYASVTNDLINNVETIVVRPPLGTNYTLTVRGRRVNVNAVSGHPDGIAQDFALVASVENTQLTNVLSFVSETPDLAVNIPLLSTPTNGLALLAQRVGANPERLGDTVGATNQWTYFVFTNLQEYTPDNVGITNGSNVAFITFLPPNLGRPRSREADIDLYVSTDPGLVSLDPAALAQAHISAKPGGTELVFFTNAPLGAIYYIGVKSEDQQAAEFGFVAISSNLPFDEEDDQGNRIVRGLPFRVAIPDGSPDQPQAGYIFGIATRSFEVQRVVATNTVVFDSTGDLSANLAHAGAFVVLNNHALDPTGLGGIVTSVFDDSGGGDTSYGTLIGRPSDGPGSLADFVGSESTGPWILAVVDNALTQVSTNLAFTLRIEPQPPEEGWIQSTVQPGGVNYYFRNVPANATNLVVSISGISPDAPLFVGILRDSQPTTQIYDKGATFRVPGGALSLGLRDVPPLNPGRYHIGVFNPNAVPVNYSILIEVETDSALITDQSFGSLVPISIPDDAGIVSPIVVPIDSEIATIKVGVRADHPRVSDLVFRLTSPQGIRLLLAENRGGPNGRGYGATVGGIPTYTTFTDDTNLTIVPIKDGVAPFTNNAVASSASNRVVFADSFERAGPGSYFAGEGFPQGWRVIGGGVDIVRLLPGSTNGFDGDQYAVLSSSQLSTLGVSVPLSAGGLYRLRYGTGRLAGSQPQGIQVYLNGRLLQELQSDTLVQGWYRDSVLFGTSDSVNNLEFRSIAGRTPLAIDGVSIEEADPPKNAFYLPEEALKPLVGQRSGGTWTLEAVDTRAGPTSAGLGVLLDWRIEMMFARPTIDAVRLTNGVPYYDSVGGQDIRYFYTEVPSCATRATNTLAGEFATLLLFGDRDGLPVADLTQFQDDYGPYFNIEAGGIASFRLTTNTPATAPLLPGQRYYLAVRNYQPDLTNNSFGIRVGFDCEDPPLPVVPSLTNGVPTLGRIDPGSNLQYYQFVVSSNAIVTEFELTPLGGGNVDLYVKQGRQDGQPLPSPNNYDYASYITDPTTVDLVRVTRVSLPVALTPGVWFVGVRNADVVPADYSILARETYTTIVNLTNAVPLTRSIAPVDPMAGLQPEDLQYFAFLVSSNSVQAQFETFGADGDVNLYVRRGLPIATPYDFHFASINPGAAPEFVAVTNTTTPIWLAPGWWFLTVENADFTNVTYTIRATEIAGTIIPLSSGVPFTNSVPPGPAPDYYSFDVSPEALSATFEVFGMSEPVELLLRQGLPLPTFNDYTFASVNPGLADEFILLTPFSFPVGLSPGPWYLGVVNPGTNFATYTVRATESVAVVVPLTNSIPYNAAIGPGSSLDYYSFDVAPDSYLAEFRLTSAGAGNLDLYLRKGPPLPDAGNSHYLSQNPGVADEVIRIDTNSLPVPLSPGIWYLAVTNREAFPIGYEITASQFGVEPPPISGQVTNIVLTETNLCITWISIPGTNYFVVAKTNALEAVWTPISPTILAIDTSTTWCLAPPGPWRFFDVIEGESPVVPIPAPVPVLRLDGTDICVGWASVIGTNYFVQGKRLSTDPEWFTLTPSIVATATFTEICYPIDLGYRYFRVGVGSLSPSEPAEVPPEQVTVTSTVDNLCLSWPSQAGLQYLVEGKRQSTDPNWTVLSEPMSGTGVALTLCLDSATEFRFFRVIEGVTVPLQPPPSVPVSNVRLSVDAAFQLCLTWDTLLNAEYFVEAKQRFADPQWTVISPILEATSIELSYCVPLGSVWRYYQVRRVNRAPDAPPQIAEITVTPVGPRLMWMGPAGARYQVFYSDSLTAIVWRPAGLPVTSLTGIYEWVDDGSATGGLSPGFRVYRIELLP